MKSRTAALSAIRSLQVDTTRRRQVKRRQLPSGHSAPLVVCRMRLWTPSPVPATASPAPLGTVAVARRAYDPLTSMILSQRATANAIPTITPWWQEAVVTAAQPHRDLAAQRHDTSPPANRAALPPATDVTTVLSTREWEVFALLAVGHSNKAIAAELVIAATTVKWYIKQIYAKLGVHSRTQAVARMPQILSGADYLPTLMLP